MSKLNNRIREVREEKKMSGTKIAKEIGISPQYFYDIEKGERNLSTIHAAKIADVLGVSVDYLIGKDDDPKLEKVNYNLREMNNNILNLLKIVTDDEGFIFEDLRKDIFNFIDEDLFFYFKREEVARYGYSHEIFNEYFNDLEYFSEYEQADLIEDFNLMFNYRTFKTVVDHLDIFEKERVIEGLKSVINKHDLNEKLPSTNAAEKEFINKLELTDSNLLKEFELTLDGEKLSEEEARGVIAYLRSLRQFDE